MSLLRLVTLLTGLPTALLAADLHVSPAGSDANPGTQAAPLATLTGARDAIRAIRKDQPLAESFTVWITPGTYEVSQPLILEAQDSGTETFSITFRAAGEAAPLFVGAPKITGFIPHQDAILKADLSALNLKDKDLTLRQLLLNGERQPLARYPNVDPADPLYQGWAFLPEFPNPLPENHLWKSEAYLKPQDIRQWAHPEEVEIDIFAQYGWWNWILPVKSLDPNTGKLTLAKPCGYDLHPHNRYYFQNALEELDAPGEWYFDKRSQTLYFRPPAPLTEQNEVRLPTLDTFIKLGGNVNHITFRGLHFTGCNKTAILLENTNHCTVAACTLRHVGHFNGSAISIYGGRHNRAIGNNISHSGGPGITLGGGDRKTLTPAHNLADNNHIHHVGRINKNGAGISLTGVGNTVSHNLIHHTPRMGIQFSGNNLVIEYNHIHHTVLETQDGGAVYTGGRDWISSRGTQFRYNFIHDTIGVGQGPDGLHHPHFTWGIYMDDNAGGLDIVGNIVARSARASLHLHNGRDHLIENNIFIDGGERQIEFNGWNATHAFFIRHHPTMIEGWDSIQGQPAWKSMRNIGLDPRHAVREDGTVMSGNRFQKNIIFWTDPALRYLDLRNCTPAHNLSDHNLVWNAGHPIRTAVTKIGPDTSAELLDTASLLKATPDGKSPKGWGWVHRPDPSLNIAAHNGVIEVPAVSRPGSAHSKSVIRSPALPYKTGAAYRTRLKVRSTEPETQLSFSYGSYANPGGYWQTTNQTVIATLEWQDVEIAAPLLAATDTRYKAWMQTLWLRMDIHADKGSVQIKEVDIREASPSTDWTSWQEEGWDKNSLVADPRFVSAESDDYRLNSDSPAFKLGFSPIPMEKIGLYPSEFRASP